VTMDEATNRPTVRFRILADGAPLNLAALPGGYAVAGNNPNFKIFWTSPHPKPTDPFDGPAIAMPADWNNLDGASRRYWDGETDLNDFAFDQPLTVGFAAAIPGLVGPDALGFFTTAPGIDPTTPVAFPAGAVMRAVAIEGTMTTPGGTLSGESVIAGVGLTETPRRQIVDINKCTLCHERIRFHGGGGRDNNPDHCVGCHNPEMTSSNVSVIGGGTGETSNNLKDMLHAIHAGSPVGGEGMRETPYIFIRGTATPGAGGGQGVHDFSHVGYPNRLNDCTTCHIGTTYLPPLPANALWSAYEADRAATVGDWSPEGSLRLPPTYSACVSCHDSQGARAHMEANVVVTRAGNHVETCTTCHGAGQVADVNRVHRLQ
jgi:OmcA/MtrC family decaheme c-type cytochrome